MQLRTVYCLVLLDACTSKPSDTATAGGGSTSGATAGASSGSGSSSGSSSGAAANLPNLDAPVAAVTVSGETATVTWARVAHGNNYRVEWATSSDWGTLGVTPLNNFGTTATVANLPLGQPLMFRVTAEATGYNSGTSVPVAGTPCAAEFCLVVKQAAPTLSAMVSKGGTSVILPTLEGFDGAQLSPSGLPTSAVVATDGQKFYAITGFLSTFTATSAAGPWTQTSAPSQFAIGYTALAAGGGLLVAAGSGHIVVSADEGKTWSAPTVIANDSSAALFYLAGHFYFTTGATTQSSTDGIHWAAETGLTDVFAGMLQSGNMLYAFGNAGQATRPADGSSPWLSIDTSAYVSVAFGNSRFVGGIRARCSSTPPTGNIGIR